MKKLIIALLCLVSPLLAKEEIANEVIQTDEYVHIIGKEKQIKVEFLNHYIAKVTPLYSNDTLVDTRYAVKPPTKKGILKFTEMEDFYRVESDSILVSISKTDIVPTVIDKISGDTMLANIDYTRPNNYKGFRAKFDTSLAIYGVSTQVARYDKRFTHLFSYNQNFYPYKYPEQTGVALTASVPYFSFGNKFSLFIDNPSAASIYLGYERTPGFFYFADDLMPAMYFINKPGQAEIVKEYYDLTGYQPMPPLWSFGYLQSNQFSKVSEVMDCVNSFISNQIPLETIILDFYWFGLFYYMGDFAWNPSDEWKNKPDMIKLFDDNNVKKVLIAEPYISVHSKNYQYAKDNDYFVRARDEKSGKDSVLVVGTFYSETSIVDFTNPAALDWFVNLMKNVTMNDNLAGWWLDQGEPEVHPRESIHLNGKTTNIHNLYGNIWTKALSDSLLSWKPKERPFILSRAGWAGVQNNYVINWSADCYNDYGTMYVQSPITLNAGICGLGYMHSDLGGFHGRKEKDSRLFVRWLQLGTFSPIMRAHSSGVIPPYPYNFGDESTAINRYFINLRYSLLPYIYTLAYENSTKGYPLCRAMNYYENIPRFTQTDDQYYFGSDILVAPIFDNTDSRKVLFPSGKWINFFTLDSYEGNSEAVVEADLSQMPLYIRSGAIIPNSTKVMNTADYNTDTLQLNYYYDSTITQSEGYAFIDDGISINTIENQQYEILSYSAEVKDSTIVFSIKRNTHKWKGAPKDRVYIINILSKEAIEGSAKAIVASDTSKIKRKVNKYGNASYISRAIKGDAVIKIAKYYNPDDSSLKENIPANSIFPNPIDNVINIPIDEKEIVSCFLQIFNSQGQEVLNVEDPAPVSDGYSLTYDFVAKLGNNPLRDGVYFGVLKVNNKTYKFHFVRKGR